MNIRIAPSSVSSQTTVTIGGSKSETNRLLLLQALYPQLGLENTSDSDDSRVMQQAISGNDAVVDIHHAGTAMRFLTAYFAIVPNREVVLTGSPRMKQRPIGILVDALRELGADIQYLETDGFPPLRINGKKLRGGTVTLPANVSSQYITALLLIAGQFESGLQLTLKGSVTSAPYIEMTLALLDQIGIRSTFANSIITVKPVAGAPLPQTLTVESDWSSASYFYSVVALSPVGTQISLAHFRQNSLQGDRALAQIYALFGVSTHFSGKEIRLAKTSTVVPAKPIKLDLNRTPDLAQTIAVTCLGLGLACRLTGLHTLKIKETDRLAALQNELQKLGASVSIGADDLALIPGPSLVGNCFIKTYDDHRMAMAFAPLGVRIGVAIEQAEVVSKSYPQFWNDWAHIGFELQQFD